MVNPRSERVESEEEIVDAVERPLGLYLLERLSLNPDCGFATFSNRPVNDRNVAARKLRAMVGAARRYR